MRFISTALQSQKRNSAIGQLGRAEPRWITVSDARAGFASKFKHEVVVRRPSRCHSPTNQHRTFLRRSDPKRGARAKIELIMPRTKHQELLKGLIRLHILHHASEAEFYGQWMIQELARHGYTLSPGTLYPMLHGLERSGYLTSKKEQDGRTFRRIYRATALGRQANRIAKIQVRELIGELQPAKTAKPRTNRSA